MFLFGTDPDILPEYLGRRPGLDPDFLIYDIHIIWKLMKMWPWWAYLKRLNAVESKFLNTNFLKHPPKVEKVSILGVHEMYVKLLLKWFQIAKMIPILSISIELDPTRIVDQDFLVNYPGSSPKKKKKYFPEKNKKSRVSTKLKLITHIQYQNFYRPKMYPNKIWSIGFISFRS